MCHGSDDIKQDLEKRIDADADLADKVGVVDFTCFGRCGEGPNLLVRPVEGDVDLKAEPGFDELDGVEGFYTEVDVERMEQILEQHCRKGEPIADVVETY